VSALLRHGGTALYTTGFLIGLALNWTALDALMFGGGTPGGSALALAGGFSVWGAVSAMATVAR
jgi:hypothetical protein